MDVTLFSILFLSFAVVYWLLGLYAARQVKTHDDYFLADRSLGFWSLTATLVATQLGSGMILGTAMHAYLYGVQGIFYSVGMCGGFLVLALGVAAAFRSFQVTTIAELFQTQFHSVTLKKVVSLLSILALSGIFIAQVVASKSLLVGLGVHNEGVFIAFWVLLVGYTMYGGLPAVVITDIMQVLIILVVFGGLFMQLWWQGTVALPSYPQMRSLVDGSTDISRYAVGYLLMPMLFSIVEQDLAQRFFAARTRQVAMTSALAASGILLLFAFIPVCLGLQARVSGVVVTDGANPLITFLAQHTGPFMYALVMCALVAAIASTADSILCAISSNVVHDFVPAAKGGQRSMVAARCITALVGLSGLVGSYYVIDILDLLTQSYELLVSCTLVPVVICLTPLPKERLAALGAIVGGGLLFILCTIFGTPCGMSRPLVSVLCSCIGYCVGMLRARWASH